MQEWVCSWEVERREPGPVADDSANGQSDGTPEPDLDEQVSAEEDKDPRSRPAAWPHLKEAVWPHERPVGPQSGALLC